MKITVSGGEIGEKELMVYQDRALSLYGERLEALDILVDGEEVELTYHLSGQPFERVRRITGYLVGTMDKWNNAKRAEELDRVKHDV